ncbi:hypothetical protein EON63_03650 [archaeon]|nr:MAG: hypothetical protein EON63_03650 [archaeon]
MIHHIRNSIIHTYCAPHIAIPLQPTKYAPYSMQVLQRLDHPHLVTLYSTFQDSGTLYYQMEYIHGSDLWYLLHDRVYDAKTGREVVEMGCLLYIHLIHTYTFYFHAHTHTLAIYS